MTSTNVVAPPESATTDRGRPADAAFPGPVVTGICMIVAPPVLALMALMASDLYKFKGHDFLTAMHAHPTRTEIFLNVVPIATIALMFACIGLAGAAARRAPRPARVGGVATVLGLCGPLTFLAIEFCGYQLSARHLAAGAFMYDQANMVPRTIMNITGPAIIVGFITLAVAARRAGLLGKGAAICFACTALLPIGFISAVLPISAIGFIACSVALVPLGLGLLRGTDESRTDAGVASPL